MAQTMLDHRLKSFRIKKDRERIPVFLGGEATLELQAASLDGTHNLVGNEAATPPSQAETDASTDHNSSHAENIGNSDLTGDCRNDDIKIDSGKSGRSLQVVPLS